ncbi:MAG TPA: aspartyl protease family protein [Candidatus Tectomicrobia bacterium]|nr:aspartyl protease family protein [Candidatus Tectomicrobia bacterium]
MLVRAALALLTATVIAGAAAAPALAEIYRYVDERGQPHYVDGLHNVPAPYRAAATPVGLRNAPAAPATVDPAASRRSGLTVIRYTPGQRIMVDARINGSVTTRLLLDTGADRTMISPRALQAAGVSMARPVGAGQVVGVTGSDRIVYVVVDSLEVGEARVGPLPVAAYQMSDSGAGDGLLGRDFLDHFTMTIDAARGEVRLAPK